VETVNDFVAASCETHVVKVPFPQPSIPSIAISIRLFPFRAQFSRHNVHAFGWANWDYSRLADSS
jgi:hypothetical protein